jgi:hypothetical protein
MIELNYLPEMPKDRSPGIGWSGCGFVMIEDYHDDGE